MSIIPAHVAGTPQISCTLPGDSTRTFGVGDSSLVPLFCVQDPVAEPFGWFASTRQVAVARKSTPNCTSWYIGLPGKDVEPLRTIVRGSGAHVYVSMGEIVYAGGGLLGIHTREGGVHQITLRNGKALTFDLPQGASTLLLDAETGKSIMN